jgi:eukaryotic-like serine/threonine-protein kinase
MRSRDYQPGEQVPGTVYKVLRLIGAGGMGTVYDVEDTTIGKRYVLKILHPKLGAREDLARRIQNEARTLARLHHPNIVEVITAGVTGDELRLPYYLMERLSGQSLRLVLEKRGQLELSHAYHIGVDLLDALDHAHDKGVVHRDVKPDNIFLHRTIAGVTVTKLLDFGIVSILDGGSRETAGRFLGTLRYAAPEQLRGEKPTPKTDVYAAALVIYEIIAGRGPFDDEGDAHQIAAAHMNKRPLPVSHFTPVPRALDSLLMAALSKDPPTRPRDAFSFAASLRNLKRLVEEARPRIDHRVTAAAVLDPTSAPTLPPDRSPSESPRSFSTESISSSAPVAPRHTTLVGMPLGSLARAGETAPTSSTPFATTHDASRRMATTNSLGPDTLPTPRHDTEALPNPTPSIPVEAFGNADTEIQWPLDRVAILSDGPQVRSLPVAGAPRRSARPLAIGITTAVATVVILVTASRVRSHTQPVVESSAALRASAPSAQAQGSSGATTTVPVLEPSTSGPSPGLSASAARPSAPPPVLAKTTAPAPSAHPKPRRPTPTIANGAERPGPGF